MVRPDLLSRDQTGQPLLYLPCHTKHSFNQLLVHIQFALALGQGGSGLSLPIRARFLSSSRGIFASDEHEVFALDCGGTGSDVKPDNDDVVFLMPTGAPTTIAWCFHFSLHPTNAGAFSGNRKVLPSPGLPEALELTAFFSYRFNTATYLPCART